MILRELSGLDIWQMDVGNVYLEAETKEKVYVIEDPEFGDLDSHVFVIVNVKALYGLKTSGIRWHEQFDDVMRDMKFFPCPAKPDIWMRDAEDHYKCIAILRTQQLKLSLFFSLFHLVHLFHHFLLFWGFPPNPH